MNGDQISNLVRIGVFYDGNYFLHVSNYYNYEHERRCRISISGLHEFIRHQVAQEESISYRLCQIVDAHYFRGRLNVKEASLNGNQLYYDRQFDDILMSEGVTTHYLPLKSVHGNRFEKGIDVWLALEAFELSQYKKFDVIVLVASDGDYVPLVRKLNTLGTRVMVLSWDFEYTDDFGQQRSTRTSQDLLEEVSYPLAMHEVIDNRLRKNEPIINNLFVPKPAQNSTPRFVTQPTGNSNDENSEYMQSTILSVKNGYGFIKFPPNNLYFHYLSLIDVDFNDLQSGDTVEFRMTKNEKQEDIATDVKLLQKGYLGI